MDKDRYKKLWFFLIFRIKRFGRLFCPLTRQIDLQSQVNNSSNVHIIGEFPSSQTVLKPVNITLESSESLALCPDAEAGPGAGGEPQLLTQ